MDATPPTTEASARSFDGDSRHVRRRNRIPLSCGPCRQRKLKCNRASPTCDNCRKRGIAASCSYSTPPNTRRPQKQASKATKADANHCDPQVMQGRLDRLEGLLMTLVDGNAQAAARPSTASSIETQSVFSGRSTDEEDDDVASDEEQDVHVGIMRVDAENKRTVYTGEAHWAALLNNISEVQTHLQTNKDQYERQGAKVAQSAQHLMQNPGPSLLFGAVKPYCREEILSQLPSRYTCDVIMAQYFKTADPAIHIIHYPTFQKQYNQHWQSPSKSSIVWIAMLFSLLRLAMLSWHRDSDEPLEFHGKCADLASLYRTQVTQALILADYTKPHAHLIETLIFHLYGEYVSSKDAQTRIWVLVAMIARLAMGMGFHRDSKWFSNISPFQGEMRRRVWTFIRQSDILFSFQSALPTMVRIGDSDTDLPHNILDIDFDEDTTVLPASRPASSTTPISFMIAKASLAFGFGRVLEEVHSSVTKKSYEEILEVDRRLRELYDNIPAHLRLRPMAEQSQDPVSQIMARFSLATLHHKSICVLHRQYLQEDRNFSKNLPSRKFCLDSAMTLLTFQFIQHEDARLERHQTSLTTNDYLLAATIICIDLYNHRDTGGSRNGGDRIFYGKGGIPRRKVLLEALKRSQDMWHAMRDRSMDAYKASEVLGMLLARLDAQNMAQRRPRRTPVTGMGTQNSMSMMSMGGRIPSRAESPAGNVQTQDLEEQRAAQTASAKASNELDSVHTEHEPTTYDSNFARPWLGSEGVAMPLFSVPEAGTYINSDWTSSYMPPPNLGDPVANLWSVNRSNDNIFTPGDAWPQAIGLNRVVPFCPQAQDGQNAILSSGVRISDTRERSIELLGEANDVSMREMREEQAVPVPTWKWNEAPAGEQGQNWRF